MLSYYHLAEHYVHQIASPTCMLSHRTGKEYKRNASVGLWNRPNDMATEIYRQRHNLKTVGPLDCKLSHTKETPVGPNFKCAQIYRWAV